MNNPNAYRLPLDERPGGYVPSDERAPEPVAPPIQPAPAPDRSHAIRLELVSIAPPLRDAYAAFIELQKQEADPEFTKACAQRFFNACDTLRARAGHLLKTIEPAS